MTARSIGRPNATSQARLQLILIVLAAWNFVSFFLELTNSALLQVGEVEGVLGGRSFNGATGVLAIAYLYAARNPVRYRFVLWLACLEQCVALFALAFHWARGEFGAAEAIAPMFVAATFLILLVANMPRQTDALHA